MCGIVGYVGNKEAAPVLLHGLQKLEYRGYDSAGIAVRNKTGKTTVVKAKGKLKSLLEKTNDGKTVKGHSGIGHTRWATHGEPTEINAHPHITDDMNVVAVHNGIIENYQELRQKLMDKGYTFYSSTDTEVIVKLLDYYYKKYKVGPIDAINKVMVRARGSYALAIMFKDHPDTVWFAKKGSPLIVAKSDDACYLASDVPAILNYSNQVYYVEDYECGCLKAGEVHFYNLDGTDITKKKTLVTVDWKADAADKGNYPHFMLKEIEEQPTVVRKTIEAYTKDGYADFSSVGLDVSSLNNIDEVYIFACGSAYHTGVIAQYIIEELCDINVRVELASEFKYRKYKLNKNSLCVIISQSGETKDTYEAMLKAKEYGIKTLAIVNVKGSTISRDADYTAYTYAGPEIAVATTKAYSCQLVVLYLLALAIARSKNTIEPEVQKKYLAEINSIPAKIETILSEKEEVQKLTNQFAPMKNVFFIGRGIDYALCLEGSLKLKEITYIHSEAYAAGELKHGTISLIEKNTGVISVATQKDLLEKSISNMVEVKSRGAKILTITSYGNYQVEDNSNYQIYVPDIEDMFSASLSIIPLQLLAYYISVTKGFDPDKPRNLAKSVTVE